MPAGRLRLVQMLTPLLLTKVRTRSYLAAWTHTGTLDFLTCTGLPACTLSRYCRKIRPPLSIPALLIRLSSKERIREEGKIMLKVHTTKLGSLAVLCVDGKLVRGETDPLRRAVLSQLDTSVVVLDLAHVNTIDAAGLGVILELREESESRGIEFRLAHVTRLVRRILELTKLDSVFKMCTKGAGLC